VTQDLGNGAITTLGHWTDTGSQITIKFDALDGQPADSPMIFQPTTMDCRQSPGTLLFWEKATLPPAQDGRVELARQQETRLPVSEPW
jgi:hypothetical protein